MITVELSEAGKQFYKLVRLVEAGETVTITRSGEAAAVLRSTALAEPEIQETAEGNAVASG